MARPKDKDKKKVKLRKKKKKAKLPKALNAHTKKMLLKLGG